MHRLSSVDLSLVAIYLAGITLFGLRFRSRDRSLKNYFLADRKIPWWAIGLSIVAAETSTLTIISVPGLAYTGDWGFLQIVLGYLLGRIVVCIIFLPRYFRGDLLTAYEVIGQRFGPRLHKLTAFLFLFLRAAAEGVRVFAVSIVVGIAIGTRDVISIAIICALTLIYTLEGGMAAVIWTDVVQMVLYVVGTLVGVLLLGHRVPGGWHAIRGMASAAGKLTIFHFAFRLSETYTFWAGLAGGCFLTMASHGADQLMVQRLLAAKNLRESRIALLSSGGVILVQFALFLAIGTGLYYFYGSASASAPDRVFPEFIVTQMPHGVAGLMVAAILAAAMSNLSAAVNSLSSSSMVDFYMAWKPDADERERARLSRVMTFFWALLLFVLALMSRGGGHVVEIGLSIASVAYGALLGVFLLGTLTRTTTESGAIVGMIGGLVVNILLWKQPHPLPKIGWTWFVLIGSLFTFALGWTTSKILPGKKRYAVLLIVLLAPRLKAQNLESLQIDRIVEGGIAAKKFPGAVVIAGHDGRIIFHKAYGNRSLRPTREPMTEDTMFDVASLTKVLVTAPAIMQLYEQGRFRLNDPVASYLPAFAANGKQDITIRQLLTHYSGLPADVSLEDPWVGKEEGLRRALSAIPVTAPGVQFRYSDINFIVLGALVEKLSGLTLDQYQQRYLAQPLGVEMRYLPPETWRSRIAPTQYDNGVMLRGVVHDPTSRRMFHILKEWWNHNGATLVFGPDGYLYITVGDGGDGYDPHEHGQDLNVVYGKILRIDVNSKTGSLQYGIPQDNPFLPADKAALDKLVPFDDKGQTGQRPEIWAYGVRNPWRVSFDRQTGELWVGDVGQDRFEEVDIIKKGGNYGWSAREGFHELNRVSHAVKGSAPIDPIIEYGHNPNLAQESKFPNHSIGISITGGYVYRGKQISALQGVYVYGDYQMGTIWGLRYENDKLTADGVLIKGNPSRTIPSFAEDSDGELYVLSFDGQIYQIVAGAK